MSGSGRAGDRRGRPHRRCLAGQSSGNTRSTRSATSKTRRRRGLLRTAISSSATARRTTSPSTSRATTSTRTSFRSMASALARSGSTTRAPINRSLPSRARRARRGLHVLRIRRAAHLGSERQAANPRLRLRQHLRVPRPGLRRLDRGLSMRAREYQPAWGRFLSPDPLSFHAAPSLYAFTGSAPLSHRDPVGLVETSFDAGNWIRGWMASWDAAFGTPPWEIGGGGLDVAETIRFGDGMANSAWGFFGYSTMAGDAPGSSAEQAAMRQLLGSPAAAWDTLGPWPHLASVNGQMRLVDASGKPYVFGTTEVHADIPLYAGEGWWKAVHAAGKAGEAAVRAIADIGEKQAIKLADGSTRVPDGVNNPEETINEVKNVSYQAFTQQIRDMWTWAQQNGYQFNLWLSEGTEASGPLEEAAQESGGAFKSCAMLCRFCRSWCFN